MTEILVSKEPLTESNCYLIAEEDQVLVIDPNEEQIVEILKKKGWTPEYVILTHEHCDHMQGLNWLRENYNIKLIAQEECSKNLANKVKNMSGIMETYLYFKNGEKEIISYAPIVCDPAEITFEREYQFFWRGHELHLQSLPGHTEGSCGIWMGRECLFSGDYLIFGEEDLTGFPGGSEEDYKRYVKPWIAKIGKEVHIYPGHGADYKMGER